MIRFAAVCFVVCTVCSINLNRLSAQVFLDYTNFEARMGELTTDAGVDPFSAGEITAIKAAIQTNLDTMFGDFDGISFTETDPGGVRPEILFGVSGGALGVAEHIDFLNRDLGDRAIVFSANFDFIIDEFTGNDDRALQIGQLSTALAGTAAHELGHNLGLRHHDAHGNLTYEGTPVPTGGEEDTHIMATGSTGLGESGREVLRDFSVNSQVKLAYANTTLLSGNPSARSEGSDAGDTLGTAEKVHFESIPVANRFGEVVIGTINQNTDVDLYEFKLLAGSVLTVDVNNDYDNGSSPDPIDLLMELLDENGDVMYTSTDTFYNTTEFGAGTTRDGDPVLYNADIFETGTYYVRLFSEGMDDIGDYQLLIHTDMFIAIPEPTTVVGLLIAGCAAVGLRRRRRR